MESRKITGPQLLTAVRQNDLEKVKQLLRDPDTNVNEKDRDGATALMYAASLGETEIMDELLKSSTINVNAQSRLGTTALMSAIFYDRLQAVNLLVNYTGID